MLTIAEIVGRTVKRCALVGYQTRRRSSRALNSEYGELVVKRPAFDLDHWSVEADRKSWHLCTGHGHAIGEQVLLQEVEQDRAEVGLVKRVGKSVTLVGGLDVPYRVPE